MKRQLCAHKTPEQRALDHLEVRRDEPRTAVTSAVSRHRQSTPHAQQRESCANRRSNGPHTECPLETDLREQGVQYEREDEAAHSRAREDNAACEPAPLREPLWEKLDDRHVQDCAGSSNTDSLQENELPDLRQHQHQNVLSRTWNMYLPALQSWRQTERRSTARGRTTCLVGGGLDIFAIRRQAQWPEVTPSEP